MVAGSGRGSNVKGAVFEREVARCLSVCWPGVERSPLRRPGARVTDGGDMVGCDGWFVEAKKHDRWKIPDWIRGVLSKVGVGQRWCLVVAGNRSSLPGTYVVLPLDVFVDLVREGREKEGVGG